MSTTYNSSQLRLPWESPLAHQPLRKYNSVQSIYEQYKVACLVFLCRAPSSKRFYGLKCRWKVQQLSFSGPVTAFCSLFDKGYFYHSLTSRACCCFYAEESPEIPRVLLFSLFFTINSLLLCSISQHLLSKCSKDTVSTMDGNSDAQRHEAQLSGSPSSLAFDAHRSSSSATQANNISLLRTRGLWPPEAQSSFLDDHSAPFLGMRPPNFSSNPARFRPLSFPAYNNVQSRNPAERSESDIVPGRNIDNRNSPQSISNRPWEAVARSSVESLVSSSTSTQNPPAITSARFERRIFLTPVTGQSGLSSSDASSAALPLPQVSGGVEESNSPVRGTSTTPTSVTRLPVPQSSSILSGLDHSSPQNDTRLDYTAPFSGEAERAAAERMIYNDNDDGMLTENRIDHFISRRNMQVNGASTSRTQDPASAGNVATRIGRSFFLVAAF